MTVQQASAQFSAAGSLLAALDQVTPGLVPSRVTVWYQPPGPKFYKEFRTWLQTSTPVHISVQQAFAQFSPAGSLFASPIQISGAVPPRVTVWTEFRPLPYPYHLSTLVGRLYSTVGTAQQASATFAASGRGYFLASGGGTSGGGGGWLILARRRIRR